ncbi:MAG: ATP-dependent helicase [Clostridia bacterium]|nr:ATP-dependent helicase [Clostridia bacterium]
MGLRKGQRELVEQYRGGYCGIAAIPGGGKTHCLSLWAVEMISQGLHKPGKILIVTYMNSAVNNFKQRIASELQKRGIAANKDYFVSTIHGLCLQIIKEKPDLISADEEFEIIDDVNKVHILSSSIQEWKRANADRFKTFVDESQLSANSLAKAYEEWESKLSGVILGAIREFKARGIKPLEAMEKCRGLGGTSLLKIAADIYEIYDRKLKTGGYFDFDDMLYNAKRVLELDSSLLERYRKKFTFVCEDEAQDSNLIQSEILTMIANGNLLRVGDSNQAICGSFTSSDFTFFKNFCELPQTTVYSITQSSRNTKDIINLANYFVRYVRERHPVPECRESLLPQYIEPVGDDDERKNPVTPEYGIKAKVFKSWEEEAAAVVMQLMHLMKANQDKTIAVLVPAAWKIEYLVGLMEERGVPCEQLDNTSKERNRTVRRIGRIIDFFALPESGEKLAEMVNECFIPDNPEDAAGMKNLETIRSRKQHKQMLADYLKGISTENILYPLGGEIDLNKVPEELLETQVWKEFEQKLEVIKDILGFPGTVIEKLILYISEKLAFNREERAIAQKIASDVRYLMSQDPHWTLSKLAQELLSSKNMFNFFANVVWELKGYEPKPGIVTVCTYHKSKGLEWDVVFLTSLNYADFPVSLKDKFIGEYWFLKQEYRNPQAIIKSELQKLMGEDISNIDPVMASKLETISEKARLLYVGITRAKEYLFLSGFHSNQGKRNESLPSGYLLELMNYISAGNGQASGSNPGERKGCAV